MDSPTGSAVPPAPPRHDLSADDIVLTPISNVGEAFVAGQALAPAERLRLIALLWASLPAEHWAAPTQEQLAELRERLNVFDAEAISDVPWEIMSRIVADRAPRPDPIIYSAPRSFDLATIFAVTTAYALLFSLLKALGMPGYAILILAGYIAAVGVGQAVLFGGRKPRLASVLVGAVAAAVLVLAYGIFNARMFGPAALLLSLFGAITQGALCGYIAGTLVGGVFLVADKLRNRFGKRPDEATGNI